LDSLLIITLVLLLWICGFLLGIAWTQKELDEVRLELKKLREQMEDRDGS